MESDPSPQDFQAVDYVPLWGASLGVMTLGFTALWVVGRELLPGSGALLVLFLILASLGTTFAICGVLLAMRDGRRLGLAVLGLAGNLSLPLLLLFGGAG